MDTTGICLTEGCGKPLAVRQAKYCPDCAKARNRAWKAAYARRRAAEAREGRVVRRRAPACPEFYAPLQEILDSGACASAVEVHAAMAARMPAGAAVPDVSALRHHCRTRGIKLPRRSPSDHARHMKAGRLSAKLLPAPDTANETAAKRKAHPLGALPQRPARGHTCPLDTRGGSAAQGCAAEAVPTPQGCGVERTGIGPGRAIGPSRQGEGTTSPGAAPLEAPALAAAIDEVFDRLDESFTILRRIVINSTTELRRLARIEEALTALGFIVHPRKEA